MVLIHTRIVAPNPRESMERDLVVGRTPKAAFAVWLYFAKPKEPKAFE